MRRTLLISSATCLILILGGSMPVVGINYSQVAGWEAVVSFCLLAEASGGIVSVQGQCSCLESGGYYCSCGTCCDSWAKDKVEDVYFYYPQCDSYCGIHLERRFECDCT